jgi:hypothetical protein
VGIDLGGQRGAFELADQKGMGPERLDRLGHEHEGRRPDLAARHVLGADAERHPPAVHIVPARHGPRGQRQQRAVGEAERQRAVGAGAAIAVKTAIAKFAPVPTTPNHSVTVNVGMPYSQPMGS